MPSRYASESRSAGPAAATAQPNPLTRPVPRVPSDAAETDDCYQDFTYWLARIADDFNSGADGAYQEMILTYGTSQRARGAGCATGQPGSRSPIRARRPARRSTSSIGWRGLSVGSRAADRRPG